MHQTLIDSARLRQLPTNTCLLFDCRFDLADTAAGQRAYQQGHIPGAHYLHLDNDLSSPISPQSGRHPLPDPERLAAKLAELGLNQDTQVVVYDEASGAVASRAWWLLRWLGHDKVALLDGGLAAWTGELEQKTPALPTQAGHFHARLQQDFTVDVTQLSQPGHPWQLVDARAAERFRGEVEPLDKVAGHVPGALSRPLTDNLQDGRFKSATQLRAEWQTLLADTALDKTVHMCGSGVTACHNQLAMEVAGLRGSRLYPGSWSEWIRDPARAIARS